MKEEETVTVKEEETVAVSKASVVDGNTPNPISSDDDAKDGSKNEEADKGKKRPNPGTMSEDDKKAERRAANRRSAFQSRQRRKILIEDLQRTVAALSKDNGDLRKTNDDLRVQLEAVLMENHQYRMQQQLAGAQGNAAAAAAAGVASSLLGGPALQSQAQALLRSGGQATLSQLLAGAGTAAATGGPAPTAVQSNTGPSPVAPAPGAPGDSTTDPFLNARLALAAAQSRGPIGDSFNQNSGSTAAPSPAAPSTNTPSIPTGPAPSQAPLGIQGILNAASLSGSSSGNQSATANQLTGLQNLLQSAGAAGLTGPSPSPQFPGGLQSLLESAARGGTPATATAAPPVTQAGAPSPAQLAGLQGILDQLSRGVTHNSSSAPTVPQAAGALTEIQRALLQGSAGPSPPQADPKSAVSDALRALLTKGSS